MLLAVVDNLRQCFSRDSTHLILFSHKSIEKFCGYYELLLICIAFAVCIYIN